MLEVAARIDRLSIAIGKAVAWFTLAMVLIQFAIVLMRYVFGIGSIWMQETILYLHGLIFMLAAAYALAVNAHVRVDIFYREAQPRTKALVDLAGATLFLLPMCAVILVIAWPYVAQSWRIFEGSRETSGIQGVFLLKSAILAFAGLMALQGLALILRAVSALRGDAAALASFEPAETT